MTDAEMNITIAKACGWVKEPDHYYADGIAWRRGKVRCSTIDLWDYCHDLNAMHEAEKSLLQTPKDLWSVFLDFLRLAVCEDADEPVNADLETEWDMVHATARQRAEAFLRTLGKWQEKELAK